MTFLHFYVAFEWGVAFVFRSKTKGVMGRYLSADNFRGIDYSTMYYMFRKEICCYVVQIHAAIVHWLTPSQVQFMMKLTWDSFTATLLGQFHSKKKLKKLVLIINDAFIMCTTDLKSCLKSFVSGNYLFFP